MWYATPTSWNTEPAWTDAFIVIIKACDDLTFGFTTQILNANYFVGDATLNLAQSPLPTCNGVPIAYSATLTTGDPLPSFIVFDNTACTFAIMTTDTADIGVWHIALTTSVAPADFGTTSGVSDS